MIDRYARAFTRLFAVLAAALFASTASIPAPAGADTVWAGMPTLASTPAADPLPPAPAVLSGMVWTTDNRMVWTVTTDAPLTTVITGMDFGERSQSVNLAAGTRELSLDMNGVPSPQLVFIVWRTSGFAQGDLFATFRRPPGVPLVVGRPHPLVSHPMPNRRPW